MGAGKPLPRLLDAPGEVVAHQGLPELPVAHGGDAGVALGPAFGVVRGRLHRAVYDSKGLPRLFTLAAPPSAPQAPAPVAPRGLLPGNLDLLDPVATPEVARPGQSVQMTSPL